MSNFKKTHIPKFRRFVLQNFPFIEEDFDALTDYGLICKVVEFLNNVIESTNESSAQVEELTDLYNELKTYVDTYFDNLDVQEEINNKLDQMSDDGELAEIISVYLNSIAVFGYDTVADMLAATNLTVGSFARTTGFYNYNDGGGAFYKIRALGTGESADNKFTFIYDTDKIAELIHGNEVNVLTIGGGSNTKFSECVNFLLDNNYNVYIPKGNYTATSTLNVVGNNKSLVCDGDITSNDTVLIHLEGYMNIIKMNGRCIGDNTVNSIFMYIGGTDRNIVCNNIYVHYTVNFGTAFKLEPANGHGCSYNNIRFDCLYSCKAYGFYITTGSGVNFVTENNIEGGRIAGATGMISGIKFKKGDEQSDEFNANIFDHVCIDDHYQIAIDIEFAFYNKFIDARLSEGLDGNYYVQLGEKAHYNYFSTKYRFRPYQINDTTTNLDHRNFFETSLVGSDTYLLADRFRTQAGYFIVDRDSCVRGLGRSKVDYAYNSTTNPTLPEFYINTDTIVVVGHDGTSDPQTFTHVLPSVFNKSGINSFYLHVRYLKANDDLVIAQSDGTTVIANRDSLGTGVISRKVYKIEYVGVTEGSKEWKATLVN